MVRLVRVLPCKHKDPSWSLEATLKNKQKIPENWDTARKVVQQVSACYADMRVRVWTCRNPCKSQVDMAGTEPLRLQRLCLVVKGIPELEH